MKTLSVEVGFLQEANLFN